MNSNNVETKDAPHKPMNITLNWERNEDFFFLGFWGCVSEEMAGRCIINCKCMHTLCFVVNT